MKYSPSELLRKLQFPAMLATAPIPVFLLLFSIFEPGLMALTWVLPVAYAAMAVGSLFIPGKFRRQFGIVCCIILMTVGIWLAFAFNTWWLAFIGVFYSVVLLAGLRFVGWEWYEELPPVVSYAGCGIFAGIQLLMTVIGFSDPEIPARMHNGMTISFLIFAMFMLLSLNRRTLNKASLQLHRASANVRNKNRTMVLIFFVIVTMLVAIPGIFEAVLELIRWIVGLLEKLRTTDEPIITEDLPVEKPSVLGPLAGKSTNFAAIMRAIFYWAATALLILAIPVLIFVGISKLRKLLKWIGKVTNAAERALDEGSEDYEEEITDIRGKAAASRLRRKKNGHVGFLLERKMPPGERVRNRYGKLLNKHKDWSASSTARENIPHDSAVIYERARYSTETVTEADAEQFIRGVKKV